MSRALYWVVKVDLKSCAIALPTRSVSPPFGSTTSYVVFGASGTSGSKLTTPHAKLHVPARGGPPIGRTVKLAVFTVASSTLSEKETPTRLFTDWPVAPSR